MYINTCVSLSTTPVDIGKTLSDVAGYIIIFLIIFVPILSSISKRINDEVDKEKVNMTILRFSENSEEVTPEQLAEMRQATLKGRGNRTSKVIDDFVGVYIIYNKTKNMYYVGQAKKVLQRANQHFTGHGNGDVYADYKYGDEFTIKTIPLNTSGYSSLDALEKDTIRAYDAFSKGYNKTRGGS